MNYTRISQPITGPSNVHWHHVDNFSVSPKAITDAHGARERKAPECTGFFFFQGNDLISLGFKWDYPQFIVYEWGMTTLFGGAETETVFWALSGALFQRSFRIGTPRAEWVTSPTDYLSDFKTWFDANTGP